MVMKKVEQREASVQKLLEAALRLFVSQGYRSTTLDRIAAAAGLTKGAVYFYFGSKEALLLELLGRVEAIVVDDAIKAIERAGPSAVDQVIRFLHMQAKLGVTHRDEVLLLILMSLEFGECDGAVRDRVNAIYLRLRRQIERVIRAGQEAGEFRRDLPVRDLAAIVMANHDGTFLEWYRRSTMLNGANLVRALRTFVIEGLTYKVARSAKAAQRAARR